MARIARLLVPWLAWLLCAGCASFSEGRLPKRSLAELEQEGKLVPITYNLVEGNSFANIESINQMGAQAAPGSSVLLSRVEPILRRVFAESTRQAQPGEWHLDMYYRETARNPALSITLAMFFIASLGLLPAYGQDDLYLEVRLQHQGETVRQYIYEESVATWMHWFMLPWSFSNDPMERKSELIDNMVLNLLHDLRSELPPSLPAR